MFVALSGCMLPVEFLPVQQWVPLLPHLAQSTRFKLAQNVIFACFICILKIFCLMQVVDYQPQSGYDIAALASGMAALPRWNSHPHMSWVFLAGEAFQKNSFSQWCVWIRIFLCVYNLSAQYTRLQLPWDAIFCLNHCDYCRFGCVHCLMPWSMVKLCAFKDEQFSWGMNYDVGLMNCSSQSEVLERNSGILFAKGSIVEITAIIQSL